MSPAHPKPHLKAATPISTTTKLLAVKLAVSTATRSHGKPPQSSTKTPAYPGTCTKTPTTSSTTPLHGSRNSKTLSQAPNSATKVSSAPISMAFTPKLQMALCLLSHILLVPLSCRNILLMRREMGLGCRRKSWMQ
jgi:hypothetical protein